jgi:trk system potassium uptake protein TrkH
MPKRFLANLGFLLQISGLLTLLPIGVGLYYDKSEAVISLFLTCVAFLGSGFLLNALCEKKDLDFKGSNFLFLGTFIVLPLIGAIPYLYLDPFQSATIADKFTNGFFESVSGFTTTGFSFISNPELLPVSLRIYRSLTELMGGVSIVFLLLGFLQSRKSLNTLSNSVGIDNINGNLKKTYLAVFTLYGGCILAFIGIFYALGFTNVFNTGTFIVDTLTGGFSAPELEFQQYMSLAPKIFTIVLMLFGALNFGFIYSLVTRKLKKDTTIEAATFFLIIALGTVSVSVAANINVFDSFFHVVSMSTSVGYNYLPMSSFGETGLSILILVMLIGGCAFSMAGGIRVSRIISFAKTTKESIINLLVREHAIVKPTKHADANESLNNISASVSILLFLATLIIFTIIFTTIGVSFTDALFEMGSALTTNGISMGATTLTMPIGYKWLIIAAMTIGRVEILSILLALFSIRKKLPVLFVPIHFKSTLLKPRKGLSAEKKCSK